MSFHAVAVLVDDEAVELRGKKCRPTQQPREKLTREWLKNDVKAARGIFDFVQRQP